MYGPSAMWRRLASNWPTEFDVHQPNWRREGIVAGALSVRDPTKNSNGLRFYLSMLMILLHGSDESDRDLYHRIPNRNLGNPYSIRHFGTRIDMDYFQSVQEYKTIVQHTELANAVVMEVGGGYGRLAHSMLSLEDTLQEFILVDLPSTLAIANRYLAAVLPERSFRKITFIDALSEFSTFDRSVDLVVNVDSMNEMDADVVAAYLAWINQYASFFYVNNPVGKYLFPADLDPTQEPVKSALSVGPIVDIFDLWDSDAIDGRLPHFCKTYSPGDRWKPIALGRSLPWTYYASAIYRKDPGAGR